MPSRLSSGTPAGGEASAVPAKKEYARSTRLTLGSYFADIVSDEHSEPPMVYWIVQRVGSPAVLGIGQQPAFGSALQEAHDCLERLVKRSRKRKKPAAVFYEFGVKSVH
jgi:hypothetical protein